MKKSEEHVQMQLNGEMVKAVLNVVMNWLYSRLKSVQQFLDTRKIKTL